MPGRRRKQWLWIGTALLLCIVTFSHPLYRAYEAVLILGDIGNAGFVPAAYKEQKLTRQLFSYPGNGQEYVADIYTSTKEPLGAIVLQHGAVETGKDDKRLVRFAEQLARARLVVMVPEMPGARQLKVSSEDIPVLLHAVEYLQQTLSPEARSSIGIGGFSISAGLAIMAAMTPEIRDDVAFVLSVGGYHDLPQTLSFMITGYYRLNGQQYHMESNEYGKWIFVLSNVIRIKDPQQRELLEKVARHKLYYSSPLPEELASQLSGGALDIYRYITNRDPDQSLKLMHRLPPSMREEIQRIDLADKDLSQFHAQLIMVHGMNDNIIPYSQSMALRDAIPPGQSRLYLLKNWHHVDPQDDGVFDAWQMFRALYRLLELRDITNGG